MKQTPSTRNSLEEQALGMVSAAETVALLQRLIAADTSESEAGAVRVLEELFDAEGIAYQLDPIAPGRDNVIVTLGPSGGRVLLLSAHTDTVQIGNPSAWSTPPLGGAVRDGRVYGRGATDDKGGVASMAMAVVALHRARATLAGRVVLTLVAGETHGNLGTLHLARNGLAADFAIVGEYSEGDKIATTYRGALWGRLVVLGKTAHPGRPHLGADAIAAALDHFIPALRRYAFDFAPHPLVPDPALTITQVEGGHRRSAIADRCEVTFDIRTVPGQDPQAIWDDLERVVTATPAPPGITVCLEQLYALGAFETPVSHPYVRLLADCIRGFTGKEPAIMGKVGMCDGNVLVNHLGIPSVAYGPGNPSGAAVDEYCDIDRLQLCTNVYIVTALRLLGVDSSGRGVDA